MERRRPGRAARTGRVRSRVSRCSGRSSPELISDPAVTDESPSTYSPAPIGLRPESVWACRAALVQAADGDGENQAGLLSTYIEGVHRTDLGR